MATFNPEKNIRTINVRSETRTYIFSDIHITTDLSLDGKAIILKLIEKLSQIARESKTKKTIVYFLGDFIDILRKNINPKDLEKHPYKELFNTIKRISDNSGKVKYILGNHDRLVATDKDLIAFLKSKKIEINTKNPYAENLKYKDNLIALDHGNQYDPLSAYYDITYKNESPISEHIVKILKNVRTNSSDDSDDWIKDSDKVKPIAKLTNWYFSKFFYKESSRSLKFLASPIIFNIFFTRVLPLILIYYILVIKKIKLSSLHQNIMLLIGILMVIDGSLFFMGAMMFIIKKDVMRVLKKFNILDWEVINISKTIQTNIKTGLNKNSTYFIKNAKNLKALIIGHTHISNITEHNGKTLIINGCWQMGFKEVKTMFSLPKVYVRTYNLNYTTIDFNNTIKIVQHQISIPHDLRINKLEKLAIIYHLRKVKKESLINKEKIIKTKEIRI